MLAGSVLIIMLYAAGQPHHIGRVFGIGPVPRSIQKNRNPLHQVPLSHTG